MMADYRRSVKGNLKNIEHEKKDNIFYHNSFVHEKLFLQLSNNLMKVFDHVGIFNYIIFKDSGSDCYCKNYISQ